MHSHFSRFSRFSSPSGNPANGFQKYFETFAFANICAIDNAGLCLYLEWWLSKGGFFTVIKDRCPYNASGLYAK